MFTTTETNNDEACVSTIMIPGSHYISLRDRHTNKYCAKCFVVLGTTKLRCSRCKIVYYCSRECQTQHYRRLHKAGCQSLSDVRSKKEEEMMTPKNQQEYGTGSVRDDSASMAAIVDLTRKEANLIFQMAYRYTSSVEHGRYMYEQAMDVYLEALQLEQQQRNNSDDDGDDILSTMWIDHSRLLWISLGYQHAFLASLFPSKMPQKADSSHDRQSSSASMITKDLVDELCQQNLWKKVKDDETDDRNQFRTESTPPKFTRALQLGILLLKLQYIASLNGDDINGSNTTRKLSKVETIQRYNYHMSMVKNYLTESGIKMIEHHVLDEEIKTPSTDHSISNSKKRNKGDVVLWMSFFNRSNSMGGMRFGPDALGWTQSSPVSSSSSTTSSPSISPPFPDFYTFLQDICFWDGNINAVISQILDGEEDIDDDDDGGDDDRER